MILLQIVILLLFISALLHSYKAGVRLYVAFLPFLHPAFAVLNISGFPLISMNRVILTFIALLFGVRYLSDTDWAKRTKEFPFSFGSKVLILSLSVVTAATTMPLGSSILNLVSVLVEHILLFLIIWCTFTTKEEIYRVLSSVFTSFLIVTIYGIITKVTGSNPFLDFMSTGEREITISYENMMRAGVLGRIQSVFYHPISYGLHLVFVFIAAVWLSQQIGRVSAKVLVLVGLIVVNIVLTNSRSPILFLLIASLGFFTRGVYLKRAIMIGFFAISVIILLLQTEAFANYAVTVLSAVMFWDDSLSSQVSGSTLQTRWLEFIGALRYFVERPITGHGLTKLRELVQFEMDPLLSYAPSFLFKLIVDTGIVGIVGYFVFFGNIAVAFRRMRKSVEDLRLKTTARVGFWLTAGYVAIICITGDLGTLPHYVIWVGLLAAQHHANGRSEQ